MQDKNKDWEDFNKSKGNYPKWPNETMLKVIFGNYLATSIELKPKMSVLDVGCGFGNNLRPFLDLGFNCSGTEVTEKMANQTQFILKEKGFTTEIKEGFNTSLPFEDKSFDILLSINVLHYENSKSSIENALEEYSRVLKKGGILFISTAGENHDIVNKAKLIGDHLYEIQNYDFRDGNTMFFFDNKKYLNLFMDKEFENIEIGKITEQLMDRSLEFLIAVGRKKD